MPLNPPIRSFSGLRVWLIGASTGIGAATARRLLEAGARVAVSARSEARLREQFGDTPDALVLPADVMDRAALEAALATVVAAWDGLDLVVALAGTYREMRAFEYEHEAAMAIWRLNFEGVMNVYASVLPQLLRQRAGGFAIVSSVAGYRGLPNSMAYGASKAALINLGESLYFDLRPRGIAVYLVNPGFVETPLTARNRFPMPGLISADEAARRLLEGLAAGHFEIRFPRGFTGLLKLLRLLPYRLYFALVRRATGTR